MVVDRYTKLVPTVIAACLLWLSVGGPSLLTPVSAQADDQRVIIAEWVDAGGGVQKLRARIPGTAGLPVAVIEQ